jgi:uncharacterized repeat protein (TIGR03803 family)
VHADERDGLCRNAAGAGLRGLGQAKIKILLETSSGYFTGPLTLDSKGNLYGVSSAGGTYNEGTVFELSPGANGEWKQTLLASFDGTDGYLPNGGLIFDGQGNLSTYDGGPHRAGTVFKLAPTSGGEWKETLVYGFSDVSLGAYPWGNLVFDKAGNLYGVANGGNTCGSCFCGEVFKLAPQEGGKWKYSVMHSFKGTDGAYPYGVVIDQGGNLFGTALGGGTYNYGVVFEIIP